MSKYVRWAYLSDLHAPYTDEAAFRRALTVITRHRPDVLVVGGDWIDASPASPYPNEDTGTLLDEYEKAAAQSKLLRTAAGTNTTLVRLVGNHEDRLELPRMNVPKRLRGATHWTNFGPLRSEWSRWETVPYIKGGEGVYELGQVIFYHGWDINSSSDELEGLQMVNLCGGHSHRLTIRGHTHAPVAPTQAMRTKAVPLPFWYANAGHCGPSQPDYMRDKDVSRWGLGMMIGEAIPNPTYRGGVQWGADLVRLNPENTSGTRSRKSR
jgi:predicted phosphodiesterase